ncbi:hypothetical protein Ancab_028917 [Ancistrocladus abbreviatus]
MDGLGRKGGEGRTSGVGMGCNGEGGGRVTRPRRKGFVFVEGDAWPGGVWVVGGRDGIKKKGRGGLDGIKKGEQDVCLGGGGCSRWVGGHVTLGGWAGDGSYVVSLGYWGEGDEEETRKF